jgi:hypothetical protein
MSDVFDDLNPGAHRRLMMLQSIAALDRPQVPDKRSNGRRSFELCGSF